MAARRRSMQWRMICWSMTRDRAGPGPSTSYGPDNGVEPPATTTPRGRGHAGSPRTTRTPTAWASTGVAISRRAPARESTDLAEIDACECVDPTRRHALARRELRAQRGRSASRDGRRRLHRQEGTRGGAERQIPRMRRQDVDSPRFGEGVAPVVDVRACEPERRSVAPLGSQRDVVTRPLARLLVFVPLCAQLRGGTTEQHECHGRHQQRKASKHNLHGRTSI